MPTPTLTAKRTPESSDVHLEIEDGDVWLYRGPGRIAVCFTEAEFEQLMVTYHALRARRQS